MAPEWQWAHNFLNKQVFVQSNSVICLLVSMEGEKSHVHVARQKPSGILSQTSLAVTSDKVHMSVSFWIGANRQYNAHSIGGPAHFHSIEVEASFMHEKYSELELKHMLTFPKASIRG